MPAPMAWAGQKATELPRSAPIPEVQPEIQKAFPDNAPSTPPQVSTPPEKPVDSPVNSDGNGIEPPPKPQHTDPRSAIIARPDLPAAEVACRARLERLGVEFEDHEAERDEVAGCSIPYPLIVTKLGKTLEIVPRAELNCQMTEALARFMVDVVSPEAVARFGADVKSIRQASAYVCRPRHNGGKMSEHAFGNALDIAEFTLANDMVVEVSPTPPVNNAQFLTAVRKAACGPFKTVLGPGSDADHTRHFHFDLEPRRNGGAFCQ